MINTLKKIVLIVLLALPITYLQSATIILTSDQQLNDLLDPDKKIDLSTGLNKRYASLREICEDAQKRGDKTLTIAFDEFFRQYREHSETTRLLTPDMDEYVQKIKVISTFAAKYGMGMGLSLLSPLELGPAFKKQTGESGQWLHYKTGIRDPETGKFNVQIWQQLFWTNNKGKFPIKLKGYKAYAFKENLIQNSPYKAVNRDNIVELQNIKFDEWGDLSKDKQNKKLKQEQWSASIGADQGKDRIKRVSVSSDGSDEYKGYDRVLIILEYEVPEMEYFSPKAYPFLQNLLKKYKDNGIKMKHFYSDEMHIQQDWIYFDHHDNGQFALRYYTPSMGKMYQEKFGVPFEQKDILYFGYGPNIDSRSATASQNVQYVLGNTREDIQKTFLFRDRYYKMLNNRVVDLFKKAKSYASEIFNVKDFGTHGHSSWAESPTIDLWNTGDLSNYAYKYEYTPNFIWGNTVHQASAGCYDYFKWGEYLEPTRNDFAECGWNDRNYYGAAMATSLGVINRIPNAYPAFWGMPAQVRERKMAINDAFGGKPVSKSIDLITGHVHRDVDVLILYPMNLVAVEERFGSWITQYGYANFITAEKLLELGNINEAGEIQIKDKKYTTLVTLFEPLPQKGVLDFMDGLLQKGGNVIWFGPPPILNANGEKCLEKWENIFGVEYQSTELQGQIAVGKRIEFKNRLKDVPMQYILTDFVLDRVYPVIPSAQTQKLAYCDNNLLVGTGNENAYYFGFRPRDDQSASLGYETRTLFEIIDHVGAYKTSGKFDGINDNTEHISRTTDYLATHFPNNTTVLVRHYKLHRECWPGGFSRDKEVDNQILEKYPLPSADINVEDLKVNGNEITFNGRLTMAFRMNDLNELIAFDGQNCNQVKINGKKYIFSDAPLKKIAFAPSLDNSETKLQILVNGEAKVKIPLTKKIASHKIKLMDNRGQKIKYTLSKNAIEFDVTKKIEGKWLILSWLD